MDVPAAAHWYFPMKPIIQLSPRYETDEQLLLPFFHAASHILQHEVDLVFLEIDQEERDEAEPHAARAARWSSGWHR